MTSGIHDTQEEVNVGNWWYESGYGFWELPGEFREISVCAVFPRGKLQRYYFDYLPATFEATNIGGVASLEAGQDKIQSAETWHFSMILLQKAVLSHISMTSWVLDVFANRVCQ